MWWCLEMESSQKPCWYSMWRIVTKLPPPPPSLCCEPGCNHPSLTRPSCLMLITAGWYFVSQPDLYGCTRSPYCRVLAECYGSLCVICCDAAVSFRIWWGCCGRGQDQHLLVVVCWLTETSQRQLLYSFSSLMAHMTSLSAQTLNFHLNEVVTFQETSPAQTVHSAAVSLKTAA